MQIKHPTNVCPKTLLHACGMLFHAAVPLIPSATILLFGSCSDTPLTVHVTVFSLTGLNDNDVDSLSDAAINIFKHWASPTRPCSVAILIRSD